MLGGGIQGYRGHGETKCSEHTGKFPDSYSYHTIYSKPNLQFILKKVTELRWRPHVLVYAP